VSEPITCAYVLEVLREGRKGPARRDEHWLAARALEMAECLSDLDGNGIIILDDKGVRQPEASDEDEL
jgi:hypothetical protein